MLLKKDTPKTYSHSKAEHNRQKTYTNMKENKAGIAILIKT